jgi:aspartyl-tRNA(Asn)/glutamyl-tRNA(Gln) amidotransferase subunit C
MAEIALFRRPCVFRHSQLESRPVMSISPEEIAWVAKLSRLQLTAEELQTYSQQLKVVLDYIDQLKEVNTDDVTPLAHPILVENVFRDDERTPSLPVQQALANAPERKDDFFVVPPVLE